MQKADVTDIMASDIAICREDESCPSTTQLLAHLQEIRKINFVSSSDSSGTFGTLLYSHHQQELLTNLAPSLPAQSLMNQLQSLSRILSSAKFTREAQTLIDIHALCLLATDFGGLGHASDEDLDPKEEAEILFLVTAWLESLNSEERSKSPTQPLLSRPEGRRGMTLSEKIFAAHDIDRRGEVKPGDVVRVDVDWIMASELSWFVRYYLCLTIQDMTLIMTGHGARIRLAWEAGYFPQRQILARWGPRGRPANRKHAKSKGSHGCQ